ncbi:hypothetical protein SISSUDRAFT_1131801 [Sistotremastrum suecicum HHB10207 ss-3]|uniref:Uncharacterized protein n=1 Tax=Sistotremastrum suecicum HHB10207 ss-3 TaxID=1314776 RepID=A0A165ZPP9_9AGAM|nr:hypothetical protein SISSUDRAFT_1131801 [Sistotremastrum suecicum HHB10207 ss-3]
MPPETKECARCQPSNRGAARHGHNELEQHGTKEVIEIGDSSEVEELVALPGLSKVPTALARSIHTHRHDVNNHRLKIKSEDPSIPDRTRVIFHARESKKSKSKSSNPAKDMIAVKCEVLIQRSNGRHVKSNALAFTVVFDTTDGMELVRARLLTRLQEPKGSWANNYENCNIVVSQVHWTFACKTEIPTDDLSDETTISQFWDTYTARPGAYFTKTDINNRVMKILILVPEDQLNAAANDISDVETPVQVARKRRQTSSGDRQKVKREKFEVKLENISIPTIKKPCLAYRKLLVVRHYPTTVNNVLSFEAGSDVVLGLVSATPIEKRMYQMSIGDDDSKEPNLNFFAKKANERPSSMDTAELLILAKSEVRSAFELGQCVNYLKERLDGHEIPLLEVPLPLIAVEVPSKDFRARVQDPNLHVWLYHEGVVLNTLFDCELQVPMISIAQTLSHISFVLSDGASVLVDFRAANPTPSHQTLQLVGPKCHTRS